MNSNYFWLLIVCLTCQWIIHTECYPNDVLPPPINSHPRKLLARRQTCPDANMCLSQWNFCGYTEAHCGEGCKAGPCKGKNNPSASCPDPNACLSQYGFCGYTAEYCGQGCKAGRCTGTGGNNNIGKSGGSNDGDVITDQNFACAFNNLADQIRGQRLDGLRQSDYKPANADEAAVFLAHVYHETAGLTTLTEFCAASNNCDPNYSQSWCTIQPTPGKSYYGRGWFQLSYPCNYNAAGQALGLDLLNNPDMVAQQQEVAVKTAVWFFEENKMVEPARRGDFAATTQIINGKVECNGGEGAARQQTRVDTYKRIRHCFGLGEPAMNPMC